MKSLPSLVAITFVVLFLATSSLAQPLDLKQRTQALALILETAKEICTETPLDQSNQEVQLSVEAKAKLSGLIKNFTSAGLSGGATQQILLEVYYKRILRAQLRAITIAS
jgi:hypothetical protein